MNLCGAWALMGLVWVALAEPESTTSVAVTETGAALAAGGEAEEAVDGFGKGGRSDWILYGSSIAGGVILLAFVAFVVVVSIAGFRRDNLRRKATTDLLEARAIKEALEAKSAPLSRKAVTTTAAKPPAPPPPPKQSLAWVEEEEAEEAEEEEDYEEEKTEEQPVKTAEELSFAWPGSSFEESIHAGSTQSSPEEARWDSSLHTVASLAPPPTLRLNPARFLLPSRPPSTYPASSDDSLATSEMVSGSHNATTTATNTPASTSPSHTFTLSRHSLPINP